jgi:hypothetical protein
MGKITDHPSFPLRIGMFVRNVMTGRAGMIDLIRGDLVLIKIGADGPFFRANARNVRLMDKSEIGAEGWHGVGCIEPDGTAELYEQQRIMRNADES